MNYGPLIFLAAFFALATSWFGFVLKPQMQIGQLSQTVTVPGNDTYPLNRAGLAQQGAEVYRANGCASCHSQNVRQFGTICEVVLTATGTNQTALIAALREIKAGASDQEIASFLTGLPKQLVIGPSRAVADKAVDSIKSAGGKTVMHIKPAGPELARGWGERQSVAEDFLYDSPVMLGSQRVGPDLAAVGMRLSDVNWHLRHLYNPRLEVKGSVMPSYRFLFEKRKLAAGASPDALVLSAGAGVPADAQIVPKREAIALVAYLTSLRSQEPLFTAPYSTATPPASSGTNAPGTNAPVAGASPTTNSTTTPAPAK